MLDRLIAQFTQMVFGDRDEIRLVEMDMAVLTGLQQCGRYNEVQVHEVFGLWLKSMDHEDPQRLTPDEQQRLVLAMEVIIAHRQRLN